MNSGSPEIPVSADGTLVILVCRAKHLPNRRKLDKQSPYVTLRLGTTAKKTPIHFRAGQIPEWTYEIRFQLSRERRPIVRLDVLDETKGEPTPIGTCEIDCSVIFDPENKRVENDVSSPKQIEKYIYDKWYDLSLNGKAAGKIYLEMTFYPSVPVLPPKVKIPSYTEEFRQSYHSQHSNKNLPSPPPQHPGIKTTAADDVFVLSESSKQSRLSGFFRGSDTSTNPSEVFVEEPAPKNKYTAKFNKLAKKFQSKEPVTKFWQNQEPEPKSRSLSPVNSYHEPFDDNLEQLARDVHDSPPPPPPPHSYSPQRLSPQRQSPLLRSPKSPLRSPARKPPPSLNNQFSSLNLSSTAIPFSADTIGLEDDNELPTQVYLLDQPVKSLTHQGNHNEAAQINGINPKYYAPTPSEHFNRTSRLQGGNVKQTDVDVDYRTQQTGYIGGGKWNKSSDKFSPSIFDRISVNDENSGYENKPHVPPKIPQGLSEMEYYVLEKDKFLKDMNGRRY